MKEQLEVLVELQLLEQKKGVLVAQKAKVDAAEVRQLWQEIRLLGEETATERQKLSCLEKVCSRQEEDLSVVTKHCKEEEARLYSGEIVSLKELEKMKIKCDAARKEIAGYESELFANMEECERLTANIAAQEELAEQRRRAHVEKQQQIVKQVAGLDSEIAKIEESCRQLAEKVDAGVLQRFRDLKRRLSLPVARVENGICSGCRISIPSSRMNESRGGIVYCDNCGRMLLVSD
ncbi:MAG: uncharacterized protein H6Q73_1401 [Firmicutes bacterium]|nr:uncharacterized protein [Bacillota bacterium]